MPLYIGTFIPKKEVEVMETIRATIIQPNQAIRLRARKETRVKPCIINLTNRFHVAVRLFSNRSQMTSKCGKNKKVAHKAQPSVSLMFLPHIDVLSGLLLNRCTATWNLFVLHNKTIKIHRKNALLFQILPL